uniref:RRM domain-containing protein n=1 Tax=Arcella intermedia TaxID=1963864 RepID=A0A6B2LQP8_9EUKA
MEVDSNERYSGKGSIFDRVERDTKEGPLKSVEGWIVFISGIHEEAGEEDIRDKFTAFGQIKNLQMPLDRRTGYVKGYAMVEYEKKAEAEKAIKDMNNATLLQQQIKVDWAFSKGK